MGTITGTGRFSFKELLGFRSFFEDPVRLGNRTYRAWGPRIWQENGKLNNPDNGNPLF